MIEMRRMGCTWETIVEATERSLMCVWNVCKNSGVEPVESRAPKPTRFRRRNGRTEKLAPKQKTYTRTNALEPHARLTAGR